MVNFQDWRDRILKLRERHSRKEDLEFYQLVEQVAEINDIDIVRTLMETFTARCESNVQQTVVRILGSFDILLYYRAFLEALPRLVSDGAGWELELGSFPERDPIGKEIRAIAGMVKTFPNDTRKLFLSVLLNDDFHADHPWADSLVNAIGK